MSEQRKADIEAALAELKFEIDLAISQGAMPSNFTWQSDFEGPPETQGESSQPWFAVLTIGKV